MALYPITVNTPVEALPHIYAEDDAAIYESISGGDGVYDIGEMLKATVLSNNNVRIGNGVLSVGGHIARIKYGDYEEMTIDNGESGKNRNDLIVARFSTTGFGGVDEFSLEVKKGVAVTGAAKDPEVETGNLYEGETIREFPLHRVRLEGISIVAVDQLFAVRKTNEQLQKEVDELNKKLILYEWETTVKPFASINPGNKLTFTVRKIGRVCTGNILWVGSVSGTNATLTDFTIPEPFRPIKTEYYSASLISSGKVFGSSRLDISNLGKVTYATDQEGFVERYVSFSYIGNDITPDEMYLVDNL